jgi:hypothetical protein
MGVVLKEGGEKIRYHYEMFHERVMKYLTYDKEIYARVQELKKWTHYLMGKETINHIDDQPPRYLEARSKLQQTRNYKWL